MTDGFIIYNFANNLDIFSLRTTYRLYSGTKTEGKYKKKSKNEDNVRLQCAEQSKLRRRWRLGNRHWKGSPQKQNILCIFCDGSIKSTRDEKWIQCTKCLLWAHVECPRRENTAKKYQPWTFCVIFFKVSVFVAESVFVPLFVHFEKLEKKIN